jgi:ribose transport system permease protein
MKGNVMSAEMTSPSLGFNPDQAAAKHAALGQRNLAAFLLRTGSLIGIFAVFVFFALTAPYFFSLGNLGNILGQSAILGVLAFGLTVVIITGGSNVVTGGIDLSLAANMGLSAAVYASLLQFGWGDTVAILGALATGLTIGLINALAVVVVGVVPLLATLAVMNVVAGLELVLTQNTVIPASSDFLSSLSANGPLGLPVLAYVLLGLAVVGTALVQFTPLGLRLYAVGEFPDAAKAAGLKVKSLTAGAFVAAGLTGGIAGILNVSYLSGSSTGAGDTLLPVVVTTLLGSVFSRRLLPTIPGTLLSAVFVGVLINGFQLLNLSSTLVAGVQGLLILLVVSATTLLRKR